MRLAALSFALAASLASAQSPTQSSAPSTAASSGVLGKDIIFGVTAGFAAPGSAWVDDEIEYDIDAGLSMAAFVDYRLAPKLFGSLGIEIMPQSGELDVDPLKALSLFLKAMVGGHTPESSYAFRPGFGLGFGSDGDADYLLVHAYTDMVTLRTARPWVFQAGLLVAPAGGNDDYDVTLTPRLTLRAGMLF